MVPLLYSRKKTENNIKEKYVNFWHNNFQRKNKPRNYHTIILI